MTPSTAKSPQKWAGAQGRQREPWLHSSIAGRLELHTLSSQHLQKLSKSGWGPCSPMYQSLARPSPKVSGHKAARRTWLGNEAQQQGVCLGRRCVYSQDTKDLAQLDEPSPRRQASLPTQPAAKESKCPYSYPESALPLTTLLPFFLTPYSPRGTHCWTLSARTWLQVDKGMCPMPCLPPAGAQPAL